MHPINTSTQQRSEGKMPPATRKTNSEGECQWIEKQAVILKTPT
jgi:hypothetical protein